MSNKIDLQIAELEKKIGVERKVKLGAESMRNMLKDKNARGEIEVSIAESQKRLDFLQGEMDKLKAKQAMGGADDSAVKSPPPGTVPLATTTSTSTLAKGSEMILDKRRSIGGAEAKRSGFLGKLGFSKKEPSTGSVYSNSTAGASSTSPTSPIVKSPSGGANGGFGSMSLSRSNSDATTGKRQQASNFEMSRADAGLTPEKIAYKVAAIQSKIEVETRVKAGAEKLLAGFDSRPVDTLSQAERKSRDDLAEKLKESSGRMTLLKTTLQRYQAMHVEGLAEDEDFSEQSSRKISGLLKVTIVAARNFVGKKSTKNEAYVIIKVDNVTQARTKTKKSVWNEVFGIFLDKAVEIEFSVYDASDALIALQFFKLADLQEEVDFINQTAEVPADGVENVWDMDPAGQIQLKFRFSNKGDKSGAITRNVAVKKRKFHVVNGHRFMSQKFYGFMKCALCQDTIITGTGYQCDSCRFLCHKKCCSQVVTKCITKVADAEEINLQQSQIIKHNVAHRFAANAVLVPTWCAHCGFMLSIGPKKSSFKCNECSLTCHNDCRVYIPNLCGMSLIMANQLMAQSMEIEKKRKAALKERGVTTEDIKRSRDSTDALNKLMSIPATRHVCLEDFHLLAVLGKGNFGKVMLAEEKASKNLFAIKVLKKDFILTNDEIESTRSEKRVFVTINKERHPFLVGLHSCFQTDTRIYFVMDYINGGDLMLHIQRQQFSEKRAKFYACEVLLALEYFHKNDIVYRDLKLDNILLTLDGHIKIADYGLCKENMGFGGTTNTFCGTPEFMAPEILLEQDYSRAVDWWAFGVLIYEMLLGQAPFKGQDEDEIFRAIIEDDVLYPVNMSKEAVSIMQALLNKDPVQRLGGSETDALEIKKHSYFDGISWDDVYHKNIPPPYVPQVAHDRDVSNFDSEFTREIPVLTPVEGILQESDQLEFKGFTYVAEWVNQSGFLNPEVPPLDENYKSMKTTAINTIVPTRAEHKSSRTSLKEQAAVMTSRNSNTSLSAAARPPAAPASTSKTSLSDIVRTGTPQINVPVEVSQELIIDRSESHHSMNRVPSFNPLVPDSMSQAPVKSQSHDLFSFQDDADAELPNSAPPRTSSRPSMVTSSPPDIVGSNSSLTFQKAVRMPLPGSAVVSHATLSAVTARDTANSGLDEAVVKRLQHRDSHEELTAVETVTNGVQEVSIMSKSELPTSDTLALRTTNIVEAADKSVES
eukprot:Partr_v1_DN28692_c0_g1_i1_m49927 putative protein kinase c